MVSLVDPIWLAQYSMSSAPPLIDYRRYFIVCNVLLDPNVGMVIMLLLLELRARYTVLKQAHTRGQRYDRQRYGGNAMEELSPVRQIHGTSNSDVIADSQLAQSTEVVLQLDITIGHLHLSPGHSAMRSPSMYDNAMKVALPNACSTFATIFPSFPPAQCTGVVLPVLILGVVFHLSSSSLSPTNN